MFRVLRRVAGVALLVMLLVGVQPRAAHASVALASPARVAVGSLMAPTDTVAASVDDGASTGLINRIIAALGVLGVFMVVVTVWLWRSSRPVAPHLEGLDLITKRRWLRAHDDRREDLLSTIRDGRGHAPAPNIVLDGHAISSGPAMPISPTASDTSLGVVGVDSGAMVPIVRVEDCSPLADAVVPADLGLLKPTLSPPGESRAPIGSPPVDASYGDTHG